MKMGLERLKFLKLSFSLVAIEKIYLINLEDKWK